MKRTATIKRKTAETDIAVSLNIDGAGKAKINTGIAFLDHMLSLFAKHGLFDLEIKAKGDLKTGIHHTNEDIGICLGEAFKKALGDKKGIRRFGLGYVVMEEALARVVLDLSSRYNLNFVEKVDLKDMKGYGMGDARHFFEAFGRSAGMNLSIGIKSGDDMHHVLEAVFKALGRALDEATGRDPRIKSIPSTKGRL